MAELSITMDVVNSTLKSEELQKVSYEGNGNVGDNLVTKQKFTKKSNYKKFFVKEDK